MHLTFRICLGFIVLLISLYSLAQTSESPPLNGIAIHSEFGKELFIGALYSSTSNNKAELSNNSSSMRMELKIIAAEGMTIRRFSRMWIEGMSINNDPVLLTSQADNMVMFDSLFKGRLVQNDHIVFNYEPTKGVDISLNDITLGNISSDDFFTMLLSTWVGKVPLSTDYKNGILKAGLVNADLKNRFDNIQPSPERSLEIANWIKTKPSAVIVDNKKSDSNSSSSTLPNETSKQAINSSAKTIENPVVTHASTKSVAINTQAKKESITKQTTQTTQQTTEDDDAPALTAQTVLARQFYISSLLKKIRANTRYPTRANQLGQGGSLRIALVIDRQGNVMNTRFVQGSEYALLNQAVLDAIEKSTPLPAMPDTLEGRTFEFTVPINFVPVK